MGAEERRAGDGGNPLYLAAPCECRQAEDHTSMSESGPAVKFSNMRFSIVTHWNISCCHFACHSFSFFSADLSG